MNSHKNDTLLDNLFNDARNTAQHPANIVIETISNSTPSSAIPSAIESVLNFNIASDEENNIVLDGAEYLENTVVQSTLTSDKFFHSGMHLLQLSSTLLFSFLLFTFYLYFTYYLLYYSLSFIHIHI